MTQSEIFHETSVVSAAGLVANDGAPCSANLGVPSWPELGERKGYSGSGTGLNRCTAPLPVIISGQLGGRDITMYRSVNKQIQLTEIRATDRDAFVTHLNDADIHRYTCRIPYPYTDACFDQWMEIVAGASAQYGEPINWAIRDRKGSLIGGIGFDNLIKGHRAEIGYWLAKPFWGHGIMSTVVAYACQVAVTEWELARLTAIVFEDNLASVRVLEKNGFAHEARLRKYFKRDGVFSDAFLFARVLE